MPVILLLGGLAGCHVLFSMTMLPSSELRPNPEIH